MIKIEVYTENYEASFSCRCDVLDLILGHIESTVEEAQDTFGCIDYGGDDTSISLGACELEDIFEESQHLEKVSELSSLLRSRISQKYGVGDINITYDPWETDE